MGCKCVAFGCKSGYYSNRETDKKEKISIFRLPNNRKIIKEWQIAISRDDIKLKAGDHVCSKHFKDDDVIREKVFKDLDGNIVAKARYLKPRLRDGAVPSLNLGRPKKPSPKPRALSLKRKEQNEKKEIENPGKKLKVENLTKTVSDDPANNETPPGPNDTEFSAKNLFNKIFQNETSINLPESWNKVNITYGDMQGITFFDRIGVKGVNGHIDSVCTKEVTLDEKMMLLIKINRKVFNNAEIDIKEEEINSTKELEAAIKRIHELQLCRGCPNIKVTNANARELNLFAYKDAMNIVRNKRCSVILKNEEEKQRYQCHCCNLTKHPFRYENHS